MATSFPAAAPRMARDEPSATPIPLPGSGYLFAGYLLLLLIEYLGLAQHVPPLQAIRLPSMIAWGLALTVCIKVGVRAFYERGQNRLLFVFLCFTALSVLYADIQMEAFTAFRSHADYFGLFLVTAYLIDRPTRVDRLVVLLSVIVVILVAVNAQLLSSSLRQGAMTGAYFVGDGNDFGWFLVLTLPLLWYPIIAHRGGAVRLAGLAGAGMCVLGIIGTQSRGASLALAIAVLYYLAFVSKRKALTAGAVIVGTTLLLFLAPSHYLQRLSTIENYEEDASAMSRIRIWGVATQMALDHPLGVGAGNFSAAYGRLYLPRDRSASGWGSSRWLSAHSVYFRALGEYGFPGLALVLTIIGLNFRTNYRTRARLRAAGPAAPISELWPAMLNVGLAAYSVAGAFLGGLTYPHLYILSALTVSASRQAELAVSQQPETAAAEPPRARFPAPRLRRPPVPQSRTAQLRRPALRRQ